MSQIGTVKIETSAHGVVSLPVFQLGDAGTNVYESVRIDLGSEVGFIPTVDPADADFNYIRFDTNQHGTVAVLDSAVLGADINLVVDTSGSMDNLAGPSVMDNDIDEFVNQFSEPDIRFSALNFDNDAETKFAVNWTTDHSQFKTDVDVSNFGGGSDYTDGIAGGHEYITGNNEGSTANGTSDGSTAQADTPNIMVILGDGTPDDEQSAENEADEVELDGHDIFTYTYLNGTASSQHAFMEDLANNVDDAFNKPAGDTPTDLANRIKNKLL